MVDKNLSIFVDMKKEQEEDLRIFKRQGVASEFLKRLFNTPHDDFWYPTIEEMLDAYVITGIANQSDLIPITYGDRVNEFSEALLSISAFKTIQKYDPEAYKRIIAALENQLRKGASQIEWQGEVATYIKTIGTRMMSQSSDEALISFTKLLVDMLQKLEQKDPILCLKALNPKKYGSFSITDYFPKEEVIPLLDVFSSIIVDAYEMKNPPVDTKAAELILQRVITKLGRYAYYLEPSSLQNREQYKLHCEATIKFYELILSEDKTTAGNALRFAFSE